MTLNFRSEGKTAAAFTPSFYGSSRGIVSDSTPSGGGMNIGPGTGGLHRGDLETCYCLRQGCANISRRVVDSCVGVVLARIEDDAASGGGEKIVKAVAGFRRSVVNHSVNDRALGQKIAEH